MQLFVSVMAHIVVMMSWFVLGVMFVYAGGM